MTRAAALAAADAYLTSGGFFEDLLRRVTHHTVSRDPTAKPELDPYLAKVIGPELEEMGFACRILPGVRTHNQNMTVAAMQMAERNSSPHLS